MSAKFLLISMTAVAVVSDSMLVPFYPQFFADVFGVTDSRHVGFYVGATCLMVMLAFPFWAVIARRVPTLQLLVYTQLAAGCLGVLVFGAESLTVFWLLSLLMIVFKGSYLLIYPYLMATEQKDRHAGIIGLLSVIVHFGAILGALLGGFVLEAFEPRHAFLVMAAGDFIQTLVCLYLIRQGRDSVKGSTPKPDQPPQDAGPALPRGFIYKLGLVMFLFYFSAFITRPFFSFYWESISALDSKVVSGFVFAIPGAMALAALWLSSRSSRQGGSPYSGILSAILLGVCGLFLQASGQEEVVLIGRCIFGWGLFQATVRLDLLLFQVSTPESYATDFSKINFFQNFGALVSSFTAGAIVAYGLQIPFIAAALGFLATALLYHRLFRAEMRSAQDAVAAT